MLTAKQHAALRAALDRIIPPGDGYPGAADAGVDRYLLGQFDRDLPNALPMYRSCLDALDAEARAAHETDFAGLPAGEQDKLLARVEKGDVAAEDAWDNDPKLFFLKLVQHATEGYYGDPGNGGNLNGASWKMIGFEVRG